MDRSIASLNGRCPALDFGVPTFVKCSPLGAAKNSFYGPCELADEITDTTSRLAVELAGM